MTATHIRTVLAEFAQISDSASINLKRPSATHPRTTLNTTYRSYSGTVSGNNIVEVISMSGYWLPNWIPKEEFENIGLIEK